MSIISLDHEEYLQQAWEELKKLHVKGNKLWAEGDDLYTREGKLYVEEDKLYAEGDKLCAEGNLVFINAVLEVHGNVEIKWHGDEATVEGVVYK